MPSGAPPLSVHVPLLELFAGFTAACFAHWLEFMGVASPGPALNARLTGLTPAVLAYLKGFGRLASFGLFTPLGATAIGIGLLRQLSGSRRLRAAPIRVMGRILSNFTEPAAAMATTEPLIFVIATAAQLPQASTCLDVEVLR